MRRAAAIAGIALGVVGGYFSMMYAAICKIAESVADRDG